MESIHASWFSCCARLRALERDGHGPIDRGYRALAATGGPYRNHPAGAVDRRCLAGGPLDLEWDAIRVGERRLRRAPAPASRLGTWSLGPEPEWLDLGRRLLAV